MPGVPDDHAPAAHEHAERQVQMPRTAHERGEREPGAHCHYAGGNDDARPMSIHPPAEKRPEPRPDQETPPEPRPPRPPPPPPPPPHCAGPHPPPHPPP